MHYRIVASQRESIQSPAGLVLLPLNTSQRGSSLELKAQSLRLHY